MKKYILALALLIPGLSYALTVDPTVTPTFDITCTLPIEREDGTPLAVGDISEVIFHSGTASGQYTLPTQSSNTCSLTVDGTQLADGDYYYTGTVKDTEGRESTYATEKVITVKRVKPPMAFTWD